MSEIVKTETSPVEPARRNGAGRPAYPPRTDIIETREGYLLLADLPGADEGSLEVTLDEGVLTIQAKPTVAPLEGAHLTFGEYELGEYYRTFRIGEELDSNRIEATLRDGVLRVEIPRTQKVTRRIEVKTS